MSWQFADGSIEKIQQYEATLNLLKTEIERLWKALPPTPEQPLGGIPFSSAFGGSGGGDQEKCFVIGKTTGSSTKSASTTTGVDVWEWNGSTHVSLGAAPLDAYNLFGSIGANKWVGVSKDLDTGEWYITAAECGS